ncbi:MAG: hypothetical protein DMF56_02645 [Acidobacteria bacterium]|nr:MAG: hypothetical protein DMF56_02645 [Acidobacteriota bacterium]
MSEQEQESSLDEMTELAAPVSSDRAQRFYDRIRQRIQNFLRERAHLEKSAHYLLLAPDVFMLLWRLVNDARVNAKNKLLLGSGLAYFFFPLDIMPEALLGPIGYMDDLVFSVYLLNKILTDTDPEVLRQHWSGSEDVLTTITNVLNAADGLVGKDLFGRLKNIVK